MCTPLASVDVGRTRENGPMRHFAPMSALSITQLAKISVSSPIFASRMTQFGPMRTRLPSVTWPSNTAFTSMNTSVAVRERAAHVDARRIGERDAGEHQVARHRRAVQALPLRRAAPCRSRPALRRRVGETSGLTFTLSFTAIATMSVR